MADALSLRSLLSKTDGSAPAIQAAAGGMMKHYDKSAGVAVVEWRNALHQARQDQHLPLLYVANEVLQNSKRNRGNKFLEAFSPILGQSLIFVCQNNPSVVEKIRRTVKIWGDRRVFSVRYVNELLKGLDPYRSGAGGTVPVTTSTLGTSQSSSPGTPQTTKAVKSIPEENKSSGMDAAESDDDLFGDTSGRLLNIDVDLDKAASAAKSIGNSMKAANNRKRRRSDLAKSSSAPKAQKRRSVLSTSSLMDLWNQVSTLQDSYEYVQSMLSDIKPEYLDEDAVMGEIDTLVGDELLQQYKQTLLYERRVADQRRELHNIAQNRKVLELEAIRYLPWLEGALKQDDDDIAFCQKLDKQAEAFKSIHGLAKAARLTRLAEEAKRRKEEEERMKKKEEEEERKKFMESAMSKVTEQQSGMVWNKATGEYQYLQTDESWRD